MAVPRRYWFTLTIALAAASLLLVWLATRKPRFGTETVQPPETRAEDRAVGESTAELTTSTPEREVATAGELAAPEPDQPKTDAPAPKTAHEFRIANMKQWLAEVESGKARLPSESLSCLMCASIAEIMDSQGRGIAREVGKRTAFPAPGSVDRVFVYNGTTYIFPSWEFQEYDQYHDLQERVDTPRNPVHDEERSAVIADIVARAHTALALNK